MGFRRGLAVITAAWLVWGAGCVSEEEYYQVREQLEIEQQRSREDGKRRRELELLVETLGKRLRLAELERDQARSKLAARESARSGGSDTGREWRLVGSIYFDAGRDSLTDTDRAKIAAIAREIAQNGAAEISVEGHSDPSPLGRSQGQYLSNMHLSAARALAVYHVLVAQPGIAPEKVSVRAYGEFRPPAGQTDGGPNALRRVEIRCSPPPRD